MRVLCMLLLCWCSAASGQTLLVLGDSISAAYGIDKKQGWVALLQRQLEQQCPDWTVKNASVSGETSAGGAVRLPRLLEENDVGALLIELGANDGLRGLPPEQLRRNLERMVIEAREAGAQVGLLGMRIPPNYGEAYTRLFEESFRSVAEEQDLIFVPFLLEGVGGEEDLMQDDDIHPTAEAQPRLLKNAWPAVRQLLDCAGELD